MKSRDATDPQAATRQKRRPAMPQTTREAVPMTTSQSALASKTALDTSGRTGNAEATAKTLEQVLDLRLR
jgi:hypothetical protein